MAWVLVILWVLGGEHRSRPVFRDQATCMKAAAQAMRGAGDVVTSVKVAYCEPAKSRP